MLHKTGTVLPLCLGAIRLQLLASKTIKRQDNCILLTVLLDRLCEIAPCIAIPVVAGNLIFSVNVGDSHLWLSRH